jgi:hypothetical protein
MDRRHRYDECGVPAWTVLDWSSCSGTIDFGDHYVLTSFCLLADDDNLDSSSNDLPPRMNAFHFFDPLGADVGPATPTGSGRWLTPSLGAPWVACASSPACRQATRAESF